VIAHRGASASAPENTLTSFQLAVQHEAGCVEHDLQVTRDGVLVCVHDSTLERTTDVKDVFPGRRRLTRTRGTTVERWFVHDLSLAEIRLLDAGSWFGPAFAGTRIPTFDELLEWARGRVAVLTEIKDVETYETLGVDPLSLVDQALHRHGYRATASGITVQSFHAPTVRRAAAMLGPSVPVALLVERAGGDRLRGRARLKRIAQFAAAIGPEKDIIAANPAIVAQAHQAGVRVTPWTFRMSPRTSVHSVRDEMTLFLNEFGVDAVITDQPDAFND